VQHKGKVVAYCINDEIASIVQNSIINLDDSYPREGDMYDLEGWSNGKKVKIRAMYDGYGYKSDDVYIPKQYAKQVRPVNASKIKSKA
jgi:hypothetical protein